MDIRNYFKKISEIVGLIDDAAVSTLVSHLETAYHQQNMVFVIGNGGSAANASHFAQDLAKGVFVNQPMGPRLKALSLTDNTPFITAVANDDGYEKIFDTQLDIFGTEGDYLIAISGSGNSHNILQAVKKAKAKKIFVIGITGFDGGELKKAADFIVHTPIHEMCSVESIHSVILHAVILSLRESLTGVIFDNSSLVCR
jgi:D-sedoheptulose 7-phosphate isomerase